MVEGKGTTSGRERGQWSVSGKIMGMVGGLCTMQTDPAVLGGLRSCIPETVLIAAGLYRPSFK